MKIVAYSRIPTSTPFVHLGYLAATITAPAWGVFWGGVVMLVGSVVAERLLRRRKHPESAVVSKPQARRLRAIQPILLLLGCITIVSAFAFGKKVYLAPRDLTQMHVAIWGQHFASSASADHANAIPDLPTQEGDYDLLSVAKVAGRPVEAYADGWNMPLILRAIRHEDRLRYVVVSAGPDRVVGTRDDITSEGRN